RLAGKLGIAPEAVDFSASLAGLGVDSLRSLELAYEIEHRFGRALTPSDLLAAESLSEIVALLEARSVRQTGEGFDVPEQEDCPLSAGQPARWCAPRLAP